MRVIKYILKTLQLATILFVGHLTVIAFLAYLSTGDLEVTGGYTIPHSFIAISLYYLIFGFWGYLLSSAIYLFIAAEYQSRSKRYLIALAIVVFAYLSSRIPDILDSDFFSNFSWQAVFSFLLLIPILVESELWLRKKKKNKGT
jgi:hypothetical protein